MCHNSIWIHDCPLLIHSMKYNMQINRQLTGLLFHEIYRHMTRLLVMCMIYVIILPCKRKIRKNVYRFSLMSTPYESLIVNSKIKVCTLLPLQIPWPWFTKHEEFENVYFMSSRQKIQAFFCLTLEKRFKLSGFCLSLIIGEMWKEI